ncbi:MAG TPA: helix-turn-helix domain-containing protein, partial [Bacilli bacterium]
AASIKEMDWSNPFYIYFLLMDTTVTLIQYVKENYKEHEQVINEIHALQKKMSQVKGNEDAFLFIRNIMEVYLKFREGFTDKYGGLIQKVKDYIHEHYHSMDLSLQQVAQNVNVSQGHLSTVFSNETGHTFIEYVTNTRIKKAMELLKTTSVKSYEIAYLVGYNDAHYFSNLFKKVTGMTTTNYRKHGASQINLIKEGE